LLPTETAAADAVKTGIVPRHLVCKAAGLVEFVGADADALGIYGKRDGAIASVYAPGAAILEVALVELVEVKQYVVLAAGPRCPVPSS
jgi:hypothetical protein